MNPGETTEQWLERLRQSQADADKASAELSEAMRLHRLNRLAAQLADEYGQAPCPRADLLEWLSDQVERLKVAGVPDSTTATAMIDAAYLEWINGGQGLLP